MSKFTRNVEQDNVLVNSVIHQTPKNAISLFVVSEWFCEMMPAYIARVRELEEENKRLLEQLDRANKEIHLLEEEKDLEDRCRSFGD